MVDKCIDECKNIIIDKKNQSYELLGTTTKRQANNQQNATPSNEKPKASSLSAQRQFYLNHKKTLSKSNT